MTKEESKCQNYQFELFKITQDMKENLKNFNSDILQAVTKKNNIDNFVYQKHYNFRDYNQEQMFFIMVSKEGFLNAKHPALIIDTIIEKLNLNLLYNKYAKEGNPSYHPKMMLKILFYAYYDGVMSSRTIWEAVLHRSDYIFLAAGQVPNFRTINNFRLRHLEDLSNLFTQIVVLCKELDMIGFENLAIDGEKIHANASYRKSKNLKGIRKEYKKIKEGMEKLLVKETNEYFSESNKSKRVKILEKKLKKVDKLKTVLEKIDAEEKRINMVDSEAPVMKHKDGRSLPSYNHQTARDEKCGVVTAVQTTQNNDQPKDLITMTDQSRKNTYEIHKNIIADSGFCDYEILEEVANERVENFYVPDKRFESSKKPEGKNGKFNQSSFKKNEEGKYLCPSGSVMKQKAIIKYKDGYESIVYEGTSCNGCHLKAKCTKGIKRTIKIDSREVYRDQMRKKLNSEKGREIYMKRQGLIESVHGDDQKNKGWIQHHLRGLKKSTAEFLLIRIATNLGTIVKYRSKEVLIWA